MITCIQSLIDKEMGQVDRLIRDALSSEALLINQVLQYLIDAGGKRVRPMIVLLCAQALGYQGSHHQILAATIELIHMATLLHDDVVDESALRRGCDTAHIRFGNAASILVGDFLYSRAFQMMVTCQSMRVMEALSSATNAIAEGEVLQLMNIGNFDMSESDYLKIIRFKTGKLFETAACLGAILSDANRAIEKSLACFGMHLGTAFQVIDDIFDYVGDPNKIGKNPKTDLSEGKPTLPLIYFMSHQDTPEKARHIREMLCCPDQVDEIVDLVRNSDALDYAYRVAAMEVDLALDHLAVLPCSSAQEGLVELTRAVIKQTDQHKSYKASQL